MVDKLSMRLNKYSVFVVAAVMLRLGDALTTYYAVSRWGPKAEMNPYVRHLIETVGIAAAMAFTVLIFIPAIVGIAILLHRLEKLIAEHFRRSKYARLICIIRAEIAALLALFLVVLALPVINNVIQLTYATGLLSP